jgi:FkbM family methyltransferase
MQPSRIAEFIMNRMLPDARGKRPGRVQRRAFAFARRMMATGGGQCLRYRLAGSELLLPLAHDLPLIRSDHPQYSTNIARLCCYAAEKYPDLCLIDVGANVGDTAAIVREYSQCPILCVEADEYYFKLLSENIRRAKFQSVEAVHAFVATYTGELMGQLASSGGTAHFVNSDADQMKAVRLSCLLNDFPRFKAPKLLKIDTDGYDCSILRSELSWLSERRPVIFFEYDPFFFRSQPYDGARIFEDISGAGYSFAVLYDNFGDYLTSVELRRDKRILADLQNYYVGMGGKRYLDVAVFHEEDRDIADSTRLKEVEWSRHWRDERQQA